MEVGFATGQGIGDGGDLDLQLLDGQASVARGDRLVTFGSQGDKPFVPGVPVGEVVAVDRHAGLADPDGRGRAVRRLHHARPRRRRRRAAAHGPARRRAAAAAAATPTPTPTVTVTVDAVATVREADVPSVRVLLAVVLVIVALAAAGHRAGPAAAAGRDPGPPAARRRRRSRSPTGRRRRWSPASSPASRRPRPAGRPRGRALGARAVASSATSRAWPTTRPGARPSCRWSSSRSRRPRRCCCTPGSARCWATRASPGGAVHGACCPPSVLYDVVLAPFVVSGRRSPLARSGRAGHGGLRR